jgi:predicted phosphodiesterase
MSETYPGPFGLVSDAHGNPYGLRAACELLQERGARTIFFLGDAVGYLPLETEVLDVLRAIPSVCVSGNHEAMLLGRLPCRLDEVYRLAAARSRMSTADRDEIGSWPDRRVVADSRAPGRKLMLMHGAPQDPLRSYVYPDSDLSFADTLDCEAFASGHTHRAFQRRRGAKLVVNCGSVGLPRDVGGLASCVLLDLAAFECEVLRVPFDVDHLLSACAAVEMPHADVVALLRRRMAEASGSFG